MQTNAGQQKPQSAYCTEKNCTQTLDVFKFQLHEDRTQQIQTPA